MVSAIFYSICSQFCFCSSDKNMDSFKKYIHVRRSGFKIYQSLEMKPSSSSSASSFMLLQTRSSPGSLNMILCPCGGDIYSERSTSPLRNKLHLFLLQCLLFVPSVGFMASAGFCLWILQTETSSETHHHFSVLTLSLLIVY